MPTFVLIIFLATADKAVWMQSVPGYSSTEECQIAGQTIMAQFNMNHIRGVQYFCSPGPRLNDLERWSK